MEQRRDNAEPWPAFLSSGPEACEGRWAKSHEHGPSQNLLVRYRIDQQTEVWRAAWRSCLRAALPLQLCGSRRTCPTHPRWRAPRRRGRGRSAAAARSGARHPPPPPLPAPLFRRSQRGSGLLVPVRLLAGLPPANGGLGRGCGDAHADNCGCAFAGGGRRRPRAPARRWYARNCPLRFGAQPMGPLAPCQRLSAPRGARPSAWARRTALYAR